MNFSALTVTILRSIWNMPEKSKFMLRSFLTVWDWVCRVSLRFSSSMLPNKESPKGVGPRFEPGSFRSAGRLYGYGLRPPPPPPPRPRQAGYARLDDRRNMQGMHGAFPTGSTNWIPLAFLSPAGRQAGTQLFLNVSGKKHSLDDLSFGFFELIQTLWSIYQCVQAINN
jgi:hypothetical protein